MEEVPPAAKFKHKALPDSTTHIRLLEIESIYAGRSQVVCLLTDWPVEEAPDYYALSYTWGSPTPSRRILINGRDFTVSQNCIYALRQAYSSKASRYFWMDALCIDQSTTQEKSHQVGMMGQIYARSVHVLACVGPHTDGSTSLFRTIDENTSLLTSIHELTLRPTVEDARYWVVPNPIPKSSWVALRCLSALNPRQRQASATAFIDFMKRPYFSRVWVLQELHLAPKISLCCGMDIRSFDYLLAVSMLVDFWINMSDYKDSLTGDASSATEEISSQIWFSRQQKSYPALRENLRGLQPQRGCLTLASGFRARRRLAEVLEAMQSFHCTDVRDRLFGVLALVEWGRSKPTVPDYGKDSFQVAVEVLRLYLDNPENEPVLGTAVEWPCRLWDTFDVKINGRAIQEAIAKRYGSHKISCEIQLTYEQNEALSLVRHYFRFRSQTPPWRRPYGGGHSRDAWYGVKLLDIADQETLSLRGRPQYYLCCKENHLRSSLASKQPLVEIMDQNNRLFAYAPEETRPDDWILISKADPYSDRDRAMVVVRSTDDIHGTYHIVGHALQDLKYRNIGFPFRHWEHFGSQWDAEDLFLFEWTYISRTVSEQPTRTDSDYLSKVVGARGDSSFFYGPIDIFTRRDDISHLLPKELLAQL